MKYPSGYLPEPNRVRGPTTVPDVEREWPSDPGDGPPRRAWVLATVIVAVLVASSVTVVAGRWLWRRATFDRIATSVTTSTSTTTPTTTSTPTPTPTSDRQRGAGGTGDPEVDRILTEISLFVERERGLEFKGPVDVEVADDTTFEERLLADFDDDADEIERTAGQLRALGLMAPGVDLHAELRNLLSVGVLGFYDPVTAELVVRGTDLTPYTRQTIAHELTHALDDQWFDLDRPDLDEATDESGFGFSALVEGNARRVENAYTNSLSAIERRELRREESMFIAGTDLSGIPVVLIEMITAPYEYGERLVARILADQGEQGIDRSYGAPPTTSEQVIHPDKYLEGEQAVPVATPPADGAVVEEGTLGEMVLEMVLSTVLDPIEARRAAEGWGGDRYVTWVTADRRTCMRYDIVMDTKPDLDELVDAVDVWAAGRRGVKVEHSTASVRVTACA